MSLKSLWKRWSHEDRKNFVVGAIVIPLILIWFIGGFYIMGHFIIKYW